MIQSSSISLFICIHCLPHFVCAKRYLMVFMVHLYPFCRYMMAYPFSHQRASASKMWASSTLIPLQPQKYIMHILCQFSLRSQTGIISGWFVQKGRREILDLWHTFGFVYPAFCVCVCFFFVRFSSRLWLQAHRWNEKFLCHAAMHSYYVCACWACLQCDIATAVATAAAVTKHGL